MHPVLFEWGKGVRDESAPLNVYLGNCLSCVHFSRADVIIAFMCLQFLPKPLKSRTYDVISITDMFCPVCIHKTYRLVGLVVKASASRAGDSGFESRLRRDISGSSHTSDL